MYGQHNVLTFKNVRIKSAGRKAKYEQTNETDRLYYVLCRNRIHFVNMPSGRGDGNDDGVGASWGEEWRYTGTTIFPGTCTIVSPYSPPVLHPPVTIDVTIIILYVVFVANERNPYKSNGLHTRQQQWVVLYIYYKQIYCMYVYIYICDNYTSLRRFCPVVMTTVEPHYHRQVGQL